MHKRSNSSPSRPRQSRSLSSKPRKSPSKSPQPRRSFANNKGSPKPTANHATQLPHQKQLKVVHFTDLHWLAKTPPTFTQMISKRVLGYANLYFNKRIEHFTDDARSRSLKKIDELQPDLIICTGDITTTALESEFEQAYTDLKPLMDKYPFFMIPGNHDVYTAVEEKNNTMSQYFHSVMHKILPQNLTLAKKDVKKQLTKQVSVNNTQHTLSTTVDNLISPDVQAQYPDLSLFLSKTKKGDDAYCLVVGLNPCRASFTTSSGEYPAAQLEQLSKLLNQTADSPIFQDSTTKKTIKPFIILSTHYPVINREGLDYTKGHPSHGVTNNHVLLELLDRSSIKPGLILHGHDHLGLAAGLITTRTNEPLADPISVVKTVSKPSFDKSSQPKHHNINYDTRVHPYHASPEYDKEGKPKTKYDIPTVSDIVHSYSAVYSPDTLSVLQESLITDLTQQKIVYNSRENLRKTNFKQVNPVISKFQEEQAINISNQTAHYFHTAPPLNVSDYLRGTLKPFGIIEFVPNKVVNGNPIHHDQHEKNMYEDAINKKEKELEKLLKERPQEVDLTIPLRDQARMAVNEKDKTFLAIDTTKQTHLAANLANQVVIPIHNPGSGSLCGYSPIHHKDWPKVAGINMYNVIARHSPLPQPKGSKAYVSGDHYTIKLDTFVQDSEGKFVQTQQSFPPYAYPLF